MPYNNLIKLFLIILFHLALMLFLQDYLVNLFYLFLFILFCNFIVVSVFFILNKHRCYGAEVLLIVIRFLGGKKNLALMLLCCIYLLIDFEL